MINEQVPEFKGPVPVHQIKLKDGRRSKLYVDPFTGKILARRNQYWRIYDFLWMLHIMDFKEREDFNNVFLKVLSLGALGIIFSGYFLFGFRKIPARIRKLIKYVGHQESMNFGKAELWKLRRFIRLAT